MRNMKKQDMLIPCIPVSVMTENILYGKGEQRRFPSIRSPWWWVGGSLARRDGNRTLARITSFLISCHGNGNATSFLDIWPFLL